MARGHLWGEGRFRGRMALLHGYRDYTGGGWGCWELGRRVALRPEVVFGGGITII